MTEKEIIAAIERARKGIGQYLIISESFPVVDVSKDEAFQRRFNAFYKVQRRSKEWYKEYYSFMEKNKTTPVPFERVLDHFNSTLGRYEPSFSSKLAATLDPYEPVWDKFVLKNIGQTAPPYSAKNKIKRAKEIFQNIREWYRDFMRSEKGQLLITTFNERIKEYDRITNVKKIDFVLWQIRD